MNESEPLSSHNIPLSSVVKFLRAINSSFKYLTWHKILNVTSWLIKCYCLCLSLVGVYFERGELSLCKVALGLDFFLLYEKRLRLHPHESTDFCVYLIENNKKTYQISAEIKMCRVRRSLPLCADCAQSIFALAAFGCMTWWRTPIRSVKERWSKSETRGAFDDIWPVFIYCICVCPYWRYKNSSTYGATVCNLND